MEETVTLSIKNVYDGGSVTKLEVTVENTLVKQLKQLIQEQNPDHPDPKDQRIIYCGKICKDETKLSEILSQVVQCYLLMSKYHCLNRCFQRRQQSFQNQNLMLSSIQSHAWQLDRTMSRTFHLVLNRSSKNTTPESQQNNRSPSLIRQQTAPASLQNSAVPVPIPPSSSQEMQHTVQPIAPSSVISSSQVAPAEETARHLLRAYCDPKYLAHQYLLQACSHLSGGDGGLPGVLADGGQLAAAQALAYARQAAAAWQTAFPQPPQGTQVQVLQYFPAHASGTANGNQQPGVRAGAGVPAPNGNANNNNNPQQRQMIGWAFFILDIKLLLKLCFMVFVLGQGRGLYSCVGLCLVAVMVYFAQTGLLRSALRLWNTPPANANADANPPANQNTPGPAQPQQAGNANQLNPPPAAQNPEPPALTRFPSGIHRGAIAPSRGSRLADAIVFTGAFFFSLLPMWRPVADESQAVQQPAFENAQQNRDGNNPVVQQQPEPEPVAVQANG